MEARRLQGELGVWKGDDLRNSEMEEKREEREVGVRREGDGRERRERSVGGESGEREGVRARWGELGELGGGSWELELAAVQLGAKRATAQWRMENGEWSTGAVTVTVTVTVIDSIIRRTAGSLGTLPAPSTQARRFKKGKWVLELGGLGGP